MSSSNIRQVLIMAWNLYFLTSGLLVPSIMETVAMECLFLLISNLRWEQHIQSLPFDTVWGTVEDTTLFIYKRGGDNAHILVSYSYEQPPSNEKDTLDDDDMTTTEEVDDALSTPPVIWKRYSNCKALYKKIQELKTAINTMPEQEEEDESAVAEPLDSGNDLANDDAADDTNVDRTKTKKAQIELWIYRGYPQSAMPKEEFFEALQIGADYKLFPRWSQPHIALALLLAGTLLHYAIARYLWSRWLPRRMMQWLVYPTPLYHFLILAYQVIVEKPQVVQELLQQGSFDSAWLTSEPATPGEYASRSFVSIGTVIQ